ncbi:thiamine synthesis protein ThiJ [Vulcanimicrobium alpinum]|uniref:Thiamine synthesis protein ThiJ n=1 Tax=Vulcanimicrobium alpinum TaxID=3016050 RepID=A0AAN1XWX8_UNVUL|nr:DJ-1/PfpI family protein [Vulcanimicrobium alpinum]BDE05858.1 thiamine synthesis protein ThiJ [Vulcanimicrobium alpinum]
MTIAILAFDGVDELDLVGPFEVFARAAQQRPGISVRIASVSGERDILGGYGLPFSAGGPLGDAPQILIVPGGGWVSGDARGVRSEIARGELPRLIAEAHRAGATIASVCTGAMAVAAAGVLGNRPATTHRGAMGDLRATGATIVDAHVVDDGDLVTSGGVTHGIDLALWLVERFFGAPLAQSIARVLEYQRTTSIWISPGTLAEIEGARAR